MAIHDIVLMGDPVLRRVAHEVTEFGDQLETLVRDLFETMYHAEGIGLAAPQIGQSMRVIVVDLRRGDADGEEPEALALVNPKITWQDEGTEKQTEGCLSIPGLEELVRRPVAVRVEGQDPAGDGVTVDADGLFARALQHEIDHLDGKLFLDRVSPLKRKILVKKWKKLQAEES